MKHKWQNLMRGDEWKNHIDEVRGLIEAEGVDYIAFNPQEQPPFALIADNEFDGAWLYPGSKCNCCGAYLIADYGDDVVILLGAESRYECEGEDD